MLKDPHLKILHYEATASNFFPNTDIKGGVAISCHDEAKDYGAIEIFTPYSELNGILHKVKNTEFQSFPKSSLQAMPITLRKSFTKTIQRPRPR